MYKYVVIRVATGDMWWFETFKEANNWAERKRKEGAYVYIMQRVEINGEAI